MRLTQAIHDIVLYSDVHRLVSVHVHLLDVESHQLVELYAMGCHPKTIAEQISACNTIIANVLVKWKGGLDNVLIRLCLNAVLGFVYI